MKTQKTKYVSEKLNVLTTDPTRTFKQPQIKVKPSVSVLMDS